MNEGHTLIPALLSDTFIALSIAKLTWIHIAENTAYFSYKFGLSYTFQVANSIQKILILESQHGFQLTEQRLQELRKHDDIEA